MVGVVIIGYLVFVFMVIASFVIGHLGLMLVDLLDASLSTEKRLTELGSPDDAARRAARVDPMVALRAE